MYSEQGVQNKHERLSGLYGNEPDKANYFLTKTWESYWRRLEYGKLFSKMKKDAK